LLLSAPAANSAETACASSMAYRRSTSSLAGVAVELAAVPVTVCRKQRAVLLHLLATSSSLQHRQLCNTHPKVP
jgi:hypothetical protein